MTYAQTGYFCWSFTLSVGLQTLLHVCSQGLEEVERAIVEELLAAIRESCPEYLCRDLTLTGVELVCSGETEGILTATASGTGTEDNVQSFLKSISEEESPLLLSVNGTAVRVNSVTQLSSQPQSDPVAEITGTCVAAGLAVLLLLLSLIVTYSIWRR